MTEKRFTIDDESDIIEFDWNTNEYIDDFMWDDGKSWDRVCNRLNELYEENEQLKSFVEYEKRQHKHWKKECLKNIKEIAQLKREIVQLKGDGDD